MLIFLSLVCLKVWYSLWSTNSIEIWYRTCRASNWIFPCHALL